ncbi:MerR family DNA-binding transcriptional regulator [Actinoplanes sp. NPDC051633]|uniref:MerR family DNA-binding transcriptional regulator n=1 Tax=Actinoplanes sp. NPDC051633 TaxID=3155670 RepID=UPI00342334F3
MRPSDLASEHGLSTQAVRNYERDGFLPPAARTAGGYRIFTETHALALRAFLALVPAHGHAAAGEIMLAVHDGRLDDALRIVDDGHDQLARDRETLNAARMPVAPPEDLTLTVGELARRLRVTPATVRKWEEAGILRPVRDRATGYRRFDASDVRDAELAHLLRRGHYPLGRIARIVRQVRDAGVVDLEDWQDRLTARGLAMLDAAGRLSDYLRQREERGDLKRGPGRARPRSPGR